MMIACMQKEFVKTLKLKKLGQHNFYLQSDPLLLEIYQLYPAKFLSAPWLAWEPAVKKTKVEL